MPRASLTHHQFFQLCEEMRNQREWLIHARPTLMAAAKHLGKKLGFPVSTHSLTTASESTGITWATKREGANKGIGRQLIRELYKMVKSLCADLGKTVPQSLIDAITEFEGSGTTNHPQQEASNETNPQPQAKPQETAPRKGGTFLS